jgi:hypothetical protein
MKEVRKACQRLTFLPLSKACTNKLYILQKCILYISLVCFKLAFLIFYLLYFRILGNRVSELEKKIKTLEVAGLWNVPSKYHGGHF